MPRRRELLGEDLLEEPGVGYDELLAEVYPSERELLRERYGPFVALRAEQTGGSEPKRPAKRPTPKPARSFRVTSDARIRCACGVYVYTVAVDGKPPALPAVCWRCGQPIGDELGHTRLLDEAGEP